MKRGRKKKEKLNNLPYDFVPTKRQKERMKIEGSVIRKCQNCGQHYITFPKKEQFYCSKCFRIKGRMPPDL